MTLAKRERVRDRARGRETEGGKAEDYGRARVFEA